ncbi:MAG: PAS domain S-box protein, partial [Bacteroidetes bacterium]|nr:PAS domain S-box protein [Bacteroidota bacterium]
MKNAPHGRTIPWFLIDVFIFLVLCILITGYILYQSQQKRLKSEAENYLAAIGDLKVNQIIQWRSDRIADGRLFLNNPPLLKTVEGLLKSPHNKARKQDLLKVMESFNLKSGYESSVLLNSKGKVLLAHSDYGDSIGGQAMSLFNESVNKREIILSDLHQSGPFPFIHMDLMIPLFSQSPYDSSLLGAFMLRIDPRVMLFQLIETWPTPSRTSETVLIKQEGDSITYINEVRHKKSTPSALRMPLSRTQLPAVMAVQGREGVVEGIDYRGVPVLAAIRHIQDSPWYMIAKIDQDEIYEPLNSLAWNVILVMLLLILLAGGFVGLWWRNQRAKFYRERYNQEMERQALIKHFDHIIKYANDSILLVDMSGRIIEVNDQACRMYGYSREEMLHLHISDIRSQKDSHHDDRELKQVEERIGLVYEAEHLRKDGTIFPVEISSRFIKIEEKRFYQSIIRDITERKKNEKLLQSAKEYAENLIQTANTIVIGLNSEGNITIFNHAAEELTGYTKSELENRGWFEVLVPKDRYPEVWEEFNRLIKGGIPKHFENPILTKDGKERNIIWSNSNIYEQNRIVGTISYGLDITERKESIEAIKKSEQRFKNLSDLLPQTVFETDEKGNLTFVNRQGFKTFGYPDNYDVKQLNILQIIVPQDRDKAIKNMQRRFSGEEIGPQEYLALKKDGSTFSVILYANRIIQENKIIGLSGIVIDIAERKRAEEALRLSEERFRRLVESVTDYIYSVKLESGHPVYTTHAPACVSVTGYTAEEYAGDPNLWYRMIYENDKTLVEELTKKILSGLDVLPIEHRIVHKNGSIRWIKNTPVLKRDSKGTLIAYDGLIEDITMQKQADEALRESEETAQALLNSTKEAAYLIDTDQRIIAVNEAGAQRFGRSIVELIGLRIADLLPPELAALRNAIFKKIIEMGKPIHFQDVQSGMHLENSGYPITDAQGKVIRIAFYSNDITERIKSEEAIRQERNLLRTLIDNLPDGIYVKDRQCRKTIANPSDVRNSGRRSESEVIGKDDFDLYSKEMAAGFFADDQTVLETGKPVINREEYVLDAEGKKRWLLTSKLPLRNEKGEITGLIGIGRDITDRILIEKDLRQSESLFKMLVESSPVAIAVFAGQSKKLEYISGRFAELFGYKMEDIPSLDAWWRRAYPIEEYRQQIEIKWIENFVNAQQKNGVTEPLESIVTCEDGSTKYIESTSTSVGNDTLVFFTDLTQHRQAQEALRQTHAFNELLMQTMPFGMDIVDEDGKILFMSKAMKDMLKADTVNSCCWIAYKDNKQQCPNCPLREGINFGKPETIEVEGIFNDRTFQISHVGMMYEGRKAILEVFQDIT